MYVQNKEQIKLGRPNKGLTKRFSAGETNVIYRNKRYVLENNHIITHPLWLDIKDYSEDNMSKVELYGYYIDNTAYKKAD